MSMRVNGAKASRSLGTKLALLTMAVLVAMPVTAESEGPGPIAVYGNTTTIELAPVLLAAERYYPGEATVKMGSLSNLTGEPGVPGFSSEGVADVATNAETQALRYSVRHPNLRILMTVTEGRYRIVARKSAGISSLADLKGKRIATIPQTSAGYFVGCMLDTVGLSFDDITAVPILPLSDMPKALAEGKVDAVAIWEPESENAAHAIGEDAIEFSGKGVYRELFNLNTTAEALADLARREKVVAFVRAIVDAARQIDGDSQRAKQLVAETSGFSFATVEQSWQHHGYIAALPDDLLDVLVAEELWLAKMDKRTPRGRDELARLIDHSVLAEALKD